jgi:hypothetical protein
VAAQFDTARRERIAFCVLAVALVVLRSFVASRYEGFFFDSDQAIVGLMARHLSRFHGFPLFYYGLNYLLGVEAWLIAPFFAVFRSSVAVMRLPLVILNAVVAVGLVVLLEGELRLRPAIAFAAALPFVIPSPGAANALLEVAGACVEPFVYVLALWLLRRRPVAYGLVLALAYLHREFTIFAVPALLLADWRAWTASVRASAGRAARIAAAFAAVWVVVGALKLWLAGGGIGLQLASLRGQMCLTWSDLVTHTQALLTEALPALLGLVPMPLSAFRMTTMLVAGSFLMYRIIAVGAILGVVRIVATRPAREGVPTEWTSPNRSGFGAYLAWVGVFTACAYPLSCNVALHTPPLLRYLLLALFIPVGLAAVYLSRERSAAWRGAIVAILVVWAANNFADNVRLIQMARADPPLSEHRALTDYLLAHHIRYARAIYWDAYVVDFLSRERVIVASTDLIRIPEYQEEVDAHAADVVMLQRMPCSGDERVASWCIQKP